MMFHHQKMHPLLTFQSIQQTIQNNEMVDFLYNT